jgi:bifunctional DNA-binding transcriptional regulator/antitoxin component of YhaV-PrlF toxin-antitoxin module
MPLSTTETFKAKLQSHNRLVVPKILRWRHRIDAGEVLAVYVRVHESRNYKEEKFVAKMSVDGRLTVPKITMQILTQREGNDLTGAIFEVTINPVYDAEQSTAEKS